MESLITLNKTLQNMGYNPAGIDEDTWLEIMHELKEIAHSNSQYNINKKAILVEKGFKSSYKSLKYDLQTDRYYVKSKNAYIFKSYTSDQLKVFIASWIKTFKQDIYSPKLVKAVIDILREDAEIITTFDKMNPKGIIAFTNGFLDIDKQEFFQDEEHGYVFTHQIDCKFDSNNKESIKKADDFIKSFIYEGWDQVERAKHVNLLYFILWYGMKRVQDMKIVLVLYGDTNTGKSVFPYIWHKILGDRFSAIMDDVNGKIRDKFFLSSVYKSQVVFMDEVKGTSEQFKNFLKSYSTKQSNVKVRIPGGDSLEADISFLLSFSTNEIFTFREDSDALRSRLVPIHFNHQHEPKHDWSIDKVLTPEVIMGIICRAMATSQRLHHKLRLPQASLDLRLAFTRHTDPVSKIIDKYVTESEVGYIRTKDLQQKLRGKIDERNNDNRYSDKIEIVNKSDLADKLERGLKKLGLPIEKTRRVMEITNPEDPSETKKIRATVYDHLKWSEQRATDKEYTEWDRVVYKLDDDVEILDDDDTTTPFDFNNLSKF